MLSRISSFKSIGAYHRSFHGFVASGPLPTGPLPRREKPSAPFIPASFRPSGDFVDEVEWELVFSTEEICQKKESYQVIQLTKDMETKAIMNS